MIHDITPLLSANTAVYPGDCPLKLTSVGTIDRDGVNLSEFKGTVHLGAHVDAPYHYFEDGLKADELDLNVLMGRCQLIRLELNEGEEIIPTHLPPLETNISRLLICAHPHWDFSNINIGFHPLGSSLATYLVQKGIKLIGIDSPSVDAFASEVYPVHKKLLWNGILILENLYLKDTPAGIYELIALPLKLAGTEAAPVRAILRSQF